MEALYLNRFRIALPATPAVSGLVLPPTDGLEGHSLLNMRGPLLPVGRPFPVLGQPKDAFVGLRIQPDYEQKYDPLQEAI